MSTNGSSVAPHSAQRGGNFTEWAKGFYPVFTRKGLIVDVRHNRGGNIDRWIIGRLPTKAWLCDG